MITQIPFPNKRLAQAGIGNPLFVTDIENATEDLLEALAVLYGFASNGFAILSGFDYGAGAYTGGIVYMNGVFYRCVAGLTENQYLTPDVQDVQNKIFSDANTYPTYRIYQAVAAGVQWGGMPQFVGNMNAYRVSIKKVYDLAVQVVNSTETVRGIVELATSAEVIAGTDTERAVTPAALTARTATDARKGIVELATSAETQTGTDAERAVTPAALTARTATDTRTGLIEIATNAEVQAGTDAERAVTPAGLESKVATESRKGIAALADAADLLNGNAEKILTPAVLLTLFDSGFGFSEEFNVFSETESNMSIGSSRLAWFKLGNLAIVNIYVRVTITGAVGNQILFQANTANFNHLIAQVFTTTGGYVALGTSSGTNVSAIFGIYDASLVSGGNFAFNVKRSDNTNFPIVTNSEWNFSIAYMTD